MCTAISYKTNDFYFGRTLDYEFSYGEEIVITPRNFLLKFTEERIIESHYAFIGVAHIAEDYPLYYDAVNEKGLGIAGLNFVGNAYYNHKIEGKVNIAPFELIPYVLGECASVVEARNLLENINLINVSFGNYPQAQLHWIISDKTGSITLESVREGIKIYDNKVGVLTNNPTFDMQMFNLNNYRHLSAKSTENTFSQKLDLNEYSRGLGALGLPGDLSSQSRFVRAVFVKENSVCENGEEKSVSQFFHILNSVEQPRGCCKLQNGSYEITIYTDCYNADKGIYYYTTYDNCQITSVDMRKVNIDTNRLIRYPMLTKQKIRCQN